MTFTIGIRREDKNEWERRVPLIPADILKLRTARGVDFVIQPSNIRVIREEEYASAGARVSDDLSAAQMILALKEIPVSTIAPGKVYVFFAHVAKGQQRNMPMLRRFLEQGCSLVAYEKIANEQNRRLIFFGRHAGYAGMIETLWCLGQRLAWQGIHTPLAQVGHAFAYSDFDSAHAHLSDLGKQILRMGLPRPLRPLVIGFAGYGNASRGAQEVLRCLNAREIPVAALPAEAGARVGWAEILKVVFREADTVKPVQPGKTFDLEDYHRNPGGYVSRFEEHLPYLDVLINAVYWEERYPRLVTCDWVKRNFAPGSHPRLKVIGDISCDIRGSIEPTLKAMKPDQPCFVYDPVTEAAQDGVAGNGPAIMAVDNLPCEFPRESSEYFSAILREVIGNLVAADWGADFERLDLPEHLKRAVIVHKGELTPAYRYLEPHLGP